MPNLKLYLAVAAALLLQSCGFSPATSSNSTCPTHLPYGVPTGTPASNDFICRDIYALSSNDSTKFADWVAFRLDRSNLTKGKTERVWQADPDINPAETLEPEDYKGANTALGTDRGHLAPIADFQTKNWQQTNYLSNIVPEKSELNRGEWAKLENHVRDLVREKAEVYVITGTFYSDKMPMPPLPGADEPHKVPSGFWQIVMYDGVMEAYLFPQDYPKNLTYRNAETNLKQIEAYSGLKFDFLSKHYREIDF